MAWINSFCEPFYDAIERAFGCEDPLGRYLMIRFCAAACLALVFVTGQAAANDNADRAVVALKEAIATYRVKQAEIAQQWPEGKELPRVRIENLEKARAKKSGDCPRWQGLGGCVSANKLKAINDALGAEPEREAAADDVTDQAVKAFYEAIEIHNQRVAALLQEGGHEAEIAHMSELMDQALSTYNEIKNKRISGDSVVRAEMLKDWKDWQKKAGDPDYDPLKDDDSAERTDDAFFDRFQHQLRQGIEALEEGDYPPSDAR